MEEQLRVKESKYSHKSGFFYGVFQDPEESRSWISFIEEPDGGQDVAQYGFESKSIKNWWKALAYSRDFLNEHGASCMEAYISKQELGSQGSVDKTDDIVAQMVAKCETNEPDEKVASVDYWYNRNERIWYLCAVNKAGDQISDCVIDSKKDSLLATGHELYGNEIEFVKLAPVSL